MVKLAIAALVAVVLSAAAVGQRPPERPWGGLVVEDGDADAGAASRQMQMASSSDSTAMSTNWSAIFANLISTTLAPLLQNIATGITNAITATVANRTLRYIPVPNVVEPLYRVPTPPPRPYSDDFPYFYREPSWPVPAPAPAPEVYRRRPPPPPPVESVEQPTQ